MVFLGSTGEQIMQLLIGDTRHQLTNQLPPLTNQIPESLSRVKIECFTSPPESISMKQTTEYERVVSVKLLHYTLLFRLK